MTVPVTRRASSVFSTPSAPCSDSANPMMYRLMLSASAKNSTMPMAPPMGRPRLREIM